MVAFDAIYINRGYGYQIPTTAGMYTAPTVFFSLGQCAQSESLSHEHP